MDSISWAIDWNPDLDEETSMKREVLRALKDDRILRVIKRLAEQAVEEAVDESLETEHLVWLDARSKHAFFIRVWYEASEKKVFIIIEENDHGDVGFLMLDGFSCANYGNAEAADTLQVEFKDPETLGVEP